MERAKTILPILFSFFVVSFVDLVGTGVDELKQSANTPDYLLQLIPFVAFIWFFLISVPAGIWQARYGKKKVLNMAILVTAFGLFVPVLGNSLPVILGSFALLGIGNTIMQVAANPLLMSVVPAERASGYLSLSQFIKSVGSMIGPYVAAVVGPFVASAIGFDGAGSWRFGLYLFGIVALLAWLWLRMTPIEEQKKEDSQVTFTSCLALLGNRYIALMVLGIFAIVGVDVAINSNIGTFLQLKIGVDGETAKYGKTVYFFAKMIGTLLGGILLMRGEPKTFLKYSALFAMVVVMVLTFADNSIVAWLLVGLISLGVANIFPLIYSITVGHYPQRSDEISGLMMMAISGGAVFPLVVRLAMGIHLNGGLWIIFGLLAFVLFLTRVKPS
ncbi:MFS transporter [Carboxylicivirga taeanensis]|uniref:MFS transporter n=1 Tax=Carboxylicivirga taeanensis TaxID=1416875 RepID=UPI003F6DF9B9